MYFQQEYSVIEFKLQDNWGTQFSYDGPHNVTMQLRGPTEEEARRGHKAPDTFVVALCEWEPGVAIRDMFASLSRNVLPEGSDKPKGKSARFIDQAGRISESYVPPLELMPRPMISLVEQVDRELSDYANRTIRVLRWVHSVGLQHRGLSRQSFTWSVDGETWKPVPSTGSLHASIYTTGFWISDRQRDYTVELVKQGVDEPLSHVLCREARQEQVHVNYRSALLLGIAAAEVGIKMFISDVLPDTVWLVENMPSPDIVKILREYLPKVPSRRAGSPKVVIPEPIINRLKDARDRRNRLSHTGKVTIDRNDLDEWMSAIVDLLWLLDYYRGYDWAISHVRKETGDLLGERTPEG